MTAENTPHDYEPGDRTDDCRICGKPDPALIHTLGSWDRPYAGPRITVKPWVTAHVRGMPDDPTAERRGL